MHVGQWLGFLALVYALTIGVMPSSRAVQPDEVLPNAGLETRARTLSRELRCMVCQNQSIDDSEAPLARDLRILVRERLTAGDSDQQVLAYLTSRYGAFVLLKPPLTSRTLLLWLTPLAVLMIGALTLLLAARRRAAPSPSVSSSATSAAVRSGELQEPGRLTPTEEARLAELMAESENRRRAS
jgi:cytochrome c-type biogenesis protein CcmH